MEERERERERIVRREVGGKIENAGKNLRPVYGNISHMETYN